MSHSAPHSERNRQILSAIVRVYIETGEPVSSRSISRRHVESLSPATIRNVMADLEEECYLYQPRTSWAPLCICVIRHYLGRTLEAIRTDLLARLAMEQEHYDLLARDALALCDPGMLGQGSTQRIYVEGAAQMAATTEFTDQAQLREVLAAIEEKHKLIALLAGCIDTPDPVHVQIGVKGIDPAGEHLALISAPYSFQDQAQGTVGVLGPMRMHYERAITAVAFVARAFSETFDRSSQSV